MVIGVLEDQENVVFHQTKIALKHELTETIATFTFKQINGHNVSNYKTWYYDLGMVAKHFTVASGALPKIRRQYTICQTMETKILKALYKLAKDILDSGPGQQIRLDESLFPREDTNRVSLTLKNYKRPHGVATQIFNVDLVGYQTAVDDNKVLVATAGSSNRPSVSAAAGS